MMCLGLGGMMEGSVEATELWRQPDFSKMKDFHLLITSQKQSDNLVKRLLLID